MKRFSPLLLVLVAFVIACGWGSKEPVEVDYVVPANVDVVQMCEYIPSGRRDKDRHCEAKTKDYRWMFDARHGHPELPAVGERIYRSEATWEEPNKGAKVEKIPERGGWWTKQ